jgi:tetratricopeptide (TPR) repeat protein
MCCNRTKGFPHPVRLIPRCMERASKRDREEEAEAVEEREERVGETEEFASPYPRRHDGSLIIPECRLCYGGEDDGPLVQPCACRGTIKWVHNHCLEHWRRTSPREDAAYRCGQCMDEYRDALSLELLSARLDTLAQELQAQGKHDEAEPLFREALEMDRETLGMRHPSTLIAINNLAQVLQAQGKYDEAEPLCREALEMERETLGDRHPDTLSSINDLGALLRAKGDLAAAEPLQREALKVRRETLGSRHPSTLNSINNLGALLKAKGDLATAELLFCEALEVYHETHGTRHPITCMAINNLDQLLEEKGDLAWAGYQL